MHSRLSLILAFMLTLLATTCTPGLSDEEKAERWVVQTLSNMSLEEMVSQMFIVEIDNTDNGLDRSLFADLRRKVGDFGAGGVLFNEGDPFRQSFIISDLQNASAVPLLVSQNMERGAGTLLPLATELPSALAFAAAGDLGLAYRGGQITAREARALGVNLILAPAIRPDSVPAPSHMANRTYGDPLSRASEFARRFIRGAQQSGVLATAKTLREFEASIQTRSPQSNTTTDSGTLLDLWKHGLSRAVDEEAGAVMFVRSQEYDLVPGVETASLDGSWSLRDFLPDRPAYEGLLISDERSQQPWPETASDSLALFILSSGADMLLAPADPQRMRNTIVSAATKGIIPIQRIRDSVRRILKAKARLDLQNRQDVLLSQIPKVLSQSRYRAFASEVARRSIVALRNRNAVPYTSHSQKIVLISLIDSELNPHQTSIENIIKVYYEGELVTHSITVGNAELPARSAISDTEEGDLLLVADLTTESRIHAPEIAQILSRLATADNPIVFVGFGSPWNAASLSDEADAILLAFGNADASYRAVADVLFGFAGTTGRLPIELSNQFPIWSGLDIAQRFPRRSQPEETGLSTDELSRLDSTLWNAVADSAFPGAAIAVGRGDALAYLKGYGRFTYDSGQQVSPESLFDLASLTKVIATTTSVMLLLEREELSLEDPISLYLPEFGTNHKENVTIRDLLTHTGGLIPFRPFYRTGQNSREAVLSSILGDSLVYEPGSRSRYSDFGPIVIALVVERITGIPFDQFVQESIFRPLGMHHTGFRKVDDPSDDNAEIVPTELDNYFRNRLIQGSVHDETAHLLGGVAGHAGLFSSAEDLAKFAFMIINEGRLGDGRFLKPETIRLFTTAADRDSHHTRALGWDTKSSSGYSSAGMNFGHQAFGHTGFTGTSIWFDPDQSLYVILLTNRVYPSRSNQKHREIRPEVANIVFDAIRTAPDSLYLDSDD